MTGNMVRIGVGAIAVAVALILVMAVWNSAPDYSGPDMGDDLHDCSQQPVDPGCRNANEKPHGP